MHQYDIRGPGFIYFMREPANYNQIKIGLSIDPIRRVKDLNSTGRAEPLELYRCFQVHDMKMVEDIIHEYLAANRYAGKEFFNVITLEQEPILGNPQLIGEDQLDDYLQFLIDHLSEGLEGINIEFREVDNLYLYEKHHLENQYGR